MDILCAFLISPCSHRQTLKLPQRMLPRLLHPATPCPAGAIPMPDSGVEYKELYLHQDNVIPVDESYIEICKAFFAFSKIRLRFLEVGCLQTVGNHFVNTLHMAAQHPDIQVKTLSIRCRYGTEKAFPTLRDDMRVLLQMPTLINLSLPPLQDAFPVDRFVPILAQELPKRHHLAAIEELDLGTINFQKLPAEEVEHLFQSIFSLPHLNQLTLSVTHSISSFHHYKLIHRLWTKYSSGERLKKLILCDGVEISERDYREELMPLLDSMAKTLVVVDGLDNEF